MSWRGPLWARVLFGVIAVALLAGLTAAIPLLGGDDLALTTPRGAWVALFVSSLLALLALATSIPFRRVRA